MKIGFNKFFRLLTALVVVLNLIMFPGQSEVYAVQKKEKTVSVTPVQSLDADSLDAGAQNAAYATNEVTVHGKVKSKKINYEKVPGTFNSVSAEEISDLKPLNVTEVIRRIPGVNYADEDGTGMKPNIGIRGLDPSRSRNVVILVDGFPLQPSSFGDPATYVNIPVEDIERIDVIKGPASLLYHGNNLGGVINYITKEAPADKKVELTNKETFGEDSLFTSETSVAGTVDRLSYRTSYLRKQGEGFRESNDYRVHDVNTSLRYQIDDQSEITSRTYWYHENSDTPGGLSRAQYDRDHLQSFTSDDNFEGRRFHTNLTYRNEFTENQVIESYFYYSFLSRDWFIASTVASGNTQFKRDFNVFGFGSKYELEYDLLGMEDNTFTFGTDYYFDKEKDISERGATATSRSGVITANNDLTAFAFDFYATTELNVTERFRVAPILRVDIVKSGLKNNLAGPSDSDVVSAWSPGVGAEFDVLDNTTAYASFHRSFQPSEYKEAINPTTASSSDLDAQQGTHYEVGVRTQPLPWFSADIAAFTFDFNNEVITQSGARVNGQETRHNGIESVLSLEIFQMAEDLMNRELPDSLGSLSTDFNFTLIDTDFRKGPNANNELPQAPNWQYNWGLYYDHPVGVYANLTAQWVDEQYSDGANTRNENATASVGVIPSYKVWNFNAGYDFNDRFGVFLGIRNLFNEKYFTRRDTFFTGITPSPDQQIYFGTKIKLG